ncbi:MAG: hypothetical protein RLZZ99_637 [Actinomycetota bacterium]
MASGSLLFCGFSEKARPAGIEPATTRLEGGCSIRLSYGRNRRDSTEPFDDKVSPRGRVHLHDEEGAQSARR